jgi:putative autotransporter adhesin-like protein
MRALAPLLLLLLVALEAAGCGGGPTVSQTRSVAPFSRIEVDGPIDVEVVPGDSRKVVVAAGENVIDHVETSSSAGVLHLSVRDRGIVIGPDPYEDMRVQVSPDGLEGVRIHGSSDMRLGHVEGDELSIEVEGSGDVEAAGSVGNLIATIQGSGDVDLGDVAARTATVSVAGSGDASVNVSDTLDVTVHGSGDVSYRGDPDLHQTVEGSGDVRSEG